MTSWPIRGQRGGAGRGGRSADPGQAGPPQALRCVGPHGLQQLLSSQLLWPSPMIHPSLRVAPAHGPPARGRKSRWCGGWRRGLQQTRGGGMILPGQREPTPGPGADSQRRSWPQTLVQSPASQVLSCRAVNASIVGGCSPTAPSGTECVCGGEALGAATWGGPGRARQQRTQASPRSPCAAGLLGQEDVFPRQVESLRVWSWVLRGPRRSHALPCPGVLTEWPGNLGQRRASPYRWNPSQESWPSCKNAQGSAGD